VTAREFSRRYFNAGALVIGGTLVVDEAYEILLGAAEAQAVPTPPAGMTRVTLPSGRTYLIRRRVASTPGPAIVGLHASAHDAANAEATFWVIPGHPEQSGWSRHAILRDYTLVLGEAVAGSWNVGGGWPGGSQNDEAYLVAVAADLTELSNVDLGQIFVAGFSAGAAMAWTMAAKYPTLFSACAMFSGWASIHPGTRLDAYHMHGTADTTVPLLGGVGVSNFTFPNMSQESALATRDSMLIYNITSGGHATPGWAAQRVLDFFTHDRNR
jgi:poly(3-hydroxybutyrate) depolymerase